MTDREMLELAAKAAGIEYHGYCPVRGLLIPWGELIDPSAWNPLRVDGDAFRLAVKLGLAIRVESHPDGVEVTACGEWDDAPEGAQETYEHDGYAATRGAIVRAAAAIGAMR